LNNRAIKHTTNGNAFTEKCDLFYDDRVRSAEETKKKLKRRKKRKAEKQVAKANKSARTAGAAAAATDLDQQEAESNDDLITLAAAAGDDDDGDDGAGAVAASDEIGTMLLITGKHKVRSFAFAPKAVAAGGSSSKKASLGQLALSLANNTLEVLDFTEEGWEVRQQISQPGHRSDVRCLALSDDDQLLLTASNAGPKLWNPETGACIASVEGGYGLCAVFAPGNKHAVIGTKVRQRWW
jgi:U3 small nucleolar RNA-associated protein 12